MIWNLDFLFEYNFEDRRRERLTEKARKKGGQERCEHGGGEEARERRKHARERRKQASKEADKVKKEGNTDRQKDGKRHHLMNIIWTEGKKVSTNHNTKVL